MISVTEKDSFVCMETLVAQPYAKRSIVEVSFTGTLASLYVSMYACMCGCCVCMCVYVYAYVSMVCVVCLSGM